MAERRACAVVREVLAMTVERRTLVDHLTHFRRDFGLPNRLHALLVRHPELFYVSIKGVRHSVFLLEAFDDDGRLLVEDALLVGRDRLEELVREGKRIRRADRNGVFAVDGDSDEDDEGDGNVAEGLSEVDGDFADLFEDSVTGEDWNVDAELLLKSKKLESVSLSSVLALIEIDRAIWSHLQEPVNYSLHQEILIQS
ncbi:hypothetical protein QYE76_001000 [Lolium multiflorum]|uniref:PORR domain-containing protein n=1 Tax=Lolium multiflorum TaxID=4521 RepID=A0AAD8VWH7_LOLMU|nr:hypothetical protein QYE76_001000 [Lolium multiflorum]